MIKFFRHIRQRMLKENRFSRYFLYAIGEIVLVVIGILIALQINNGNVDRTERKVEKEYIASLIEDLAVDTARYAILIDRFRLKEARIDTILRSFHLLPHRYDHSLYNNLPEVIHYGDFIYTDKTIKQLMSAGGMRLIRDKEIVSSIIDYDSSVRRLTESLMPDLEFYYQNSNEMWFEVMDIAAYEADTALLTITEMERGSKTYLLRSDKETLGKWNNIIRNFQGDLIMIREMEEALKIKATRLIELLKKEYDLDPNV